MSKTNDLDNALDELFDDGKRYGEDLGYAKDDALYELRIEAISDAKKFIQSLLRQRTEEIVDKLISHWNEREKNDWEGKNKQHISDLIAKLRSEYLK